MIFTKAQRIELAQLSQQLFGSDTYWQRVHKKRRVPAGVQNIETTRYMRLKSGQLITAANAIECGLIPAMREIKGKDGAESTFEPQPLTQSKATVIYRKATFDEMKKDMLTALEAKQFGEMPPVQMILTAAVKYLKGELLNMPYLVVGENGQKDFDDLLTLVPEDKREAVVRQKVPQGNPNLFCLDGVQFLSDVVFANARPEKAAEMLEQYANGLAAAEEGVAPGQPDNSAGAAQA